MKLTEQLPGSKLPIVDNPDIAEVYVDHMTGVLLNDGNLSLTFSTTRSDHTKYPQTQHRQIVLRVVMPGVVAREITANLSDFINQLDRRGLLPSAVQKTVQPK